MFTKGEWREFIDDEGDVWVLAGDAKPGEHHAYYIGNMEDTCGECHGNAALMVAAPELLEALELVMDCLLVNTGFVPHEAKVAYEKAKGEPYDTRKRFEKFEGGVS